MIRTISIILISICFVQIHTYSQETWELKKERNGISAYTMDMPDSKFKAYKVITSLATDLNTIVSILQDLELFSSIFQDTKEVKIAKRISESEYLLYLHTNAPFPVKDREGIYHYIYSYQPEIQTVNVNIHCSDEVYNSDTGRIRIKKCSGYWKLKQIDSNIVELEYYFHANPGGKIPSFLVNQKSIDSPLFTVEKIREIIEDGYISKKAFSFITN